MAYGIVYSMQILRINGRSELDLKYNYSSRSSYIYGASIANKLGRSGPRYRIFSMMYNMVDENMAHATIMVRSCPRTQVVSCLSDTAV